MKEELDKFKKEPAHLADVLEYHHTVDAARLEELKAQTNVFSQVEEEWLNRTAPGLATDGSHGVTGNDDSYGATSNITASPAATVASTNPISTNLQA